MVKQLQNIMSIIVIIIIIIIILIINKNFKQSQYNLVRIK